MMPGHDQKTVRVSVEVDGYTWRIHGARTGLRWHCHLVELVGPLPLDGPVTLPLRDKIRSALAKVLAVDECEIARIPADVILA